MKRLQIPQKLVHGGFNVNKNILRARNCQRKFIKNAKMKNAKKTCKPNNCNLNCDSIELLNRLRVGFSHLKQYKFRHNFEDATNPLCSCGNFVESTTHFFPDCTHFSNPRLTLINKIKDIGKRIFINNNSLITHFLLFGDEKLSITDSKSILEAIIQLLISSRIFDSPLF